MFAKRFLLSSCFLLLGLSNASATGLFLAEGGFDLSLEDEIDRPLMTGRLGIDLFPISFETVTIPKGEVWHGLAFNLGRTLDAQPEEWISLRYIRGGHDGELGFGKAVGLAWHWGQRRGPGWVMDWSLMHVALGGRIRFEAMYDFRSREPAVFLSFMMTIGEILPWFELKRTRSEDVPFSDNPWGL